MTRRKILYISSINLDTSSGAHIAMYRHLVYKQDFDVAVCSYVASNALVMNKQVIPWNFIQGRLIHSRLSKLVYNLHYILSWYFLPQDLIRFAQQYQPDLILTVPDNLHSGLALGLAKKLKIPLVANFQDLFPLSRFIPPFMEPFSWVRYFLNHQFFKLHRESNLTFYTSEGMQQYFPSHDNGHILYPLGDFERPDIDLKDLSHSQDLKPPLTIIYAGNCYGSYGRMLLRFAREVKNSEQIQLKIFPVGKGWTDEEIQEMTEAGIYQSFLPFDELRKELARAAAFLTVMSFEENDIPFVKTSFTTKWLDYTPYAKPIFVWSPEYASATIFARHYDVGVVVNEDNASKLKNAILELSQSQDLWQFYGKQSRKISNTVLNPNQIHQVFREQITQLAQS